MINKRNKMHRIHAEGRRYWESRRFEVFTVPHSRFSKDAFGIADAIVISKDKVIFVQYSSNQFHNKKKYEEFARNHKAIMMILMRWIDGKGFDMLRV
jgi:hypothetical protein